MRWMISSIFPTANSKTKLIAFSSRLFFWMTCSNRLSASLRYLPSSIAASLATRESFSTARRQTISSPSLTSSSRSHSSANSEYSFWSVPHR